MQIIQAALAEDIKTGDITTNIFVDRKKISEACIVAKENAVICGLGIVQETFRALDKNTRVRFFCKDGQRVKKGFKVARLKGKTRILLTGERVALNFLSHLSGIATATRAFSDAIRPYRAKIFDTRKTIPGLRGLQKYAVRCGGGKNHRLDLNDLILIKDNHQLALPKMSLQSLIGRAKKISKKPVEIEVDTLRKFRDALNTKADIILLDNMSPHQIKQAVWLKEQLKKGQKPLLEASGGVTLKNARAIARTGVNRISIGALTHSADAIDFSMEIVR